ncbi:hypothetical protein B0T25DRAFT_447036 [Lasiosphaeria hispida]|uniref:Uncharacterized protein n=1 Tax=Lasiosphaeria hispida TaxID=260671 RepID=A0AAJ0HSC1_9PEZI|nr:hypothetical protein B0T25DRAFT_447036 [Lasiosphaeria hispida]
MSWRRVSGPYKAFEDSVNATTNAFVQGPPPFPSTIWEVSADAPNGEYWGAHLQHPHLQHLQKNAHLRIIFAPLDDIRPDYAPGILDICNALAIPPEFLSERLHHVCHSFGSRIDDNGFAAWFHFLCKKIEWRKSESGLPVIDGGMASLPGANYKWHRSAFFVRKNRDGDVAMVCFGASGSSTVRKRLADFIAAGSWKHVNSEPLVLFDLVLEALYNDVDETVWKLNDVIGPLEHHILDTAQPGRMARSAKDINFAELHNNAKHVIHVAEAIESCFFVLESIITRIGKRHPAWPSVNTPADEVPIQEQLKDCLQHRLSLFKSTDLRLSSLRKRIDNMITLSFNLVTQQDSSMIRHDSASMNIIAFITIFFLPTACVATVMGSQLFITDLNTMGITMSPLFISLWWVVIPMTVFVTGVAGFYRWRSLRD